MGERVIGEIVLLQVQVRSLKQGESPRRWYDPAGLVQVERLEIGPDGISATIDGDRVLDVHNANHPHSKNRRGVNGVSLGFTDHYRVMHERFGDHLTTGIAGENIIVRSDAFTSEDDLARGAEIVREDGSRVALAGIIAAPPCAEFSRWALRYGADDPTDLRVTETVRFLNDGMRGYYATAPVAQEIRVGDRLIVPS